MEEETDEERYTLTSFEPLSPEHEKPSFFRSIGAFAKKKLTGNAHDRQPGHETSTRVEKAPENGTQLYPKKQNFIEGLPTPRLEDNNESKWKTNDSKFGSRLPPRPKTPISSNRNTRTPSSVLRRLSLLVLVDKTSQQQSKSSDDLKQYWMPDEQCKVCYECGVKFNTFRRRHHCRLCGQIFCSRCCNEELSRQQIGYTGVFRVCVYCKKIVLTYTSSSDVENNLRQLKEDLSLVAQPDCTNSPASGLLGRNTSFDDPELNRAFDVLGVSAEEANLLKQDSLKDLWLQITAPKAGLECHSHRMRLRTYSNCLIGRELVDWLMVHRKAQNRCQAIQVCQGLQDSGWIEPLVGSRELEFKDDFASLYIPGSSATGESSFPGFRSTTPLLVHENLTTSNNSDDFFIKRRYYKEKCEVGSALSVSYDQRFLEKDREGFHKSHSTSKIRNMEPFVAEFQNRSLSCEELFLKVDTIINLETQSMRSQSPFAVAQAFTSQQATVPFENADGDDQDVDEVTANDLSLSVAPEESDESAAFEQLGSIHRQHISSFLVQLLDRVRLSQSWKEIIEPLVVKVTEMVIPDVAHDDEMDIRQYVKIKKIPEGERSACRIVSGIVCTKNIVHKKMAKSITQPQILMLACPVDFQRVENKLASLDPLVLQEEEFLKNYVGRIVALKPTLVLVGKTVSRLAKDMLLSKGISVILNVKPKLMARISRCTEGDVLPSLDQGSRPRLGTCQNFKTEKFVFKNGSTKTLSFFEGCNPRLGSTIVLRGANVAELSRVRDILKFMLFVTYNSKLEKAFIMDEFGTPFRQEQIENVKENGETDVENENERSFGNESEGVEEMGSENVASPDEEVKFQISPKKVSEQTDKGLKHEETSEKDEHCSGSLAIFNEKTVSIEDNYIEDKTRGNVVNCESFKKVLDNVILCSSPLITYPVPYILTSEGQRCELLAYMPDDLYWSPMFSESLSDGRCSPDEDYTDSDERPESRDIFVKETHPFVFAVLKKDAGEVEVRELLAHYRAQGGKITLKNRSKKDESVFIPCQNESDGLGKAVDVPDGVADTFHRKNCDNGRRDEQFSVTSMKDCFDPFFHQMIAILFSSYSSNSSNFPHPCISPWTVFMEFYAKNDIALGCFLERYCFRSSYVCPNPNCAVPMVQHVRYFAHGNGAVYINMKNLESPIPGFSKTLLTWSWCKACKQVTPVVPVSPEAWRLSFAKYLELRMYGTCYKRRSTDAPCSHSLHQDHYQYFAFNNIVASFKYIPVKVFEVHLPPSTITLLEEERQPQFWVKHIQEMSVRVHHLVNMINDRIASLKTESFISNCVTDIGHDKGQMYEKIKVLESKSMLLLNPPSSPDETNDSKLLEPHEILGLEYEILDGLTLLKRMMCQYGKKWNTQLLELHQLENEKKKYKTIDGRNSSSTQVISQSPVDSVSSFQTTSDSVFNNCSSSAPPVESVIDSEMVVIPDNQDTLNTTQEDSQPQDVTNSANLSAQTLVDEEQTSSSSSSDESETKIDALNGPRGISTSSCEKKIQRHSELWATLSREVNSTLKDAQFLEDPPGPKMKRIMSRVLPGVNFRPIPSPFPPHQHHLLPTSEMIPIVVNEKEPTSIIAYTLSTVDYHKKLHEIQDSMIDMESDGESFTCIDVEADGACRLSTQSGAGPTRNRTRSEAETISSTSLMTKLDDFVDNYFDCSESDDEENGLKNDATKDEDGPSDVKTDEDVKRDEDSVADGKEQPSTFNSSAQEDVEYHIKHSFSDSSAKFFCVVYFGEQFRRIRKTVFPEGEEKYVRSLQHCLKWRATGGKSGSSFSKTTDDRFVIKGMSRPEAQSFLNIAPYYFQYIDKAINEKRPTLLAKIVGVYRIGCTSKTTNTPIREDLLVMDNLLYNCKVDRVFDLKGSIRSRYVMSVGGNSVLMDENLLEMISDSPLFIRPHSKAVLSRAINQDTEFLARHMVMDYSLLLGIERDSSRLIVGIIDFIRTFTWDKKLEMYVKSTGILGGQGKMPTVVSPELYRERFCEAMQRYFLMIPNKWIGLGNELK